MSKIFSVLVVLFLASCAANVESPVVYFSNVSPEKVKKIECVWANNSLSLAALNPGDTRSQSFLITSESKFFGQIYVTWYNSRNEKVSKNFHFRKENLPSIHDKTAYNYVQLYFDQDDIEIISSDAADLTGKIRRMEQVMNKYHDDYIRNGAAASGLCANNNLGVCQAAENSALISVKRRTTDLTPGTY